jgi:hypothetical protein
MSGQRRSTMVMLVAAGAATLLLLAADGRAPRAAAEESTMEITSSAFQHEAEIPKQYTCEGQDISPPLSWSGVPKETKSLALIVDDPDAPDPEKPQRVWVHWVLFDIPPDVSGLPEETDAPSLPPGTRQGMNDWNRTGYGGPCPPIGRHRYFFKLYALDTKFERLTEPTKKELLAAIDDHVLAQAELMGTYEKQGK